MHESVLAQQIVLTVLLEANRCGAVSVASVDVEVGALDALSEEGIREAFAVEARGTPLESARLNLRTREGRGLVVRKASFVT